MNSALFLQQSLFIFGLKNGTQIEKMWPKLDKNELESRVLPTNDQNFNFVFVKFCPRPPSKKGGLRILYFY